MAFIVHKDRMQVRRSYKAIWERKNPVLLEGEIGFEIDTNKIKIGNGINGWNNLTFLTGIGGSIEVQEEGTSLSLGVTKLNFVGDNVTVTEPITDEILISITTGFDTSGNIEGGSASSIYQGFQNIDGGDVNSIFTSQALNGGGA